MIQMLINLGKWLEQRFPQKLIVKSEDWFALKLWAEDVHKAGVQVKTDILDIQNRLKVVEANAVHKEPVKLLVEEMAKMKAELVSLRAGLGITSSASSPEGLEAMLNGEFIKQGGQNG